MIKEIEYKIFIKYSFKGDVIVNIPRKGKHTVGKIMKRTEMSDFLYLENGIPKLRVEFEEDGIQYTKYVCITNYQNVIYIYQFHVYSNIVSQTNRYVKNLII